jgi:hypothetical protein
MNVNVNVTDSEWDTVDCIWCSHFKVDDVSALEASSDQILPLHCTVIHALLEELSDYR